MLPLITSLRCAARIQYAAHKRSSALFHYVTSHAYSSAHGRSSSWRQYAAAAGLAGLLSLNFMPVSHGDAAYSDDVSEEERRKRFNEWMVANGADWTAAEVKPCKNSEAGQGLFATHELRRHMSHSWLGRRLGAMILPGAKNQTVQAASIPLDLAFTAEAARSDPDFGGPISELMDLGLLDERNAIIVMLMIERLKGPGSTYAPYIQMIPASFDTPLWFTEEQLSELSGTTLAAATAARAASISRTWERLRPAVSNMLKQVGVFTDPTLDDFKWATSVFWSRGLGLPVPQESDTGVLSIHMQEGLVPGLDFANHSQQARCWWEVVQQQQQQPPLDSSSSSSSSQSPATSGSHYVISLMTNRACCPKTGEELLISYGDKGNEELLLLYEFALKDNPNDTLMVLCPVPAPGEWDEVLTARMQLLQARNLKPQIFLSASHLENYQRAAAAARSGSSSSSSSIIPAAAREVIQVFVMQEKELAAALDQIEQQQPGDPSHRLINLPGASKAAAAVPSSSSSSGSVAGSSDSTEARLEQLGLDMAVLTTFVRLQELKMVQMEGEAGTGPLEDDIRRLQEADAIRAAHQQHGQHAAAAAEMPAGLRNCLSYRIGQKQLVRGYLAAARKELQDTLTELQTLMESRGDSVD